MDKPETKEMKSMIKEETIEVAKNIERGKIAKEAFIKIIKAVTEIMEKIKGNTKNKKRISDIIKLYIKNLNKYTDVSNKEIADLLEIVSSALTNILREKYKENDFIIKSNREIDKNVKL